MNSASHATEESRALIVIRKFLLGTLLVGIVGTELELLLLGHFEVLAQMMPVILLMLGALVLAWHAARPRAATVRALQATMMLYVVSGPVGVFLHYRGNVEFEREMYPSLTGMELVGKTLTGATPVLAPGTMTLLGCAGLMHAYRHPCLKDG